MLNTVRKGYAFLITILVIGIAAAMMSVVLLLSGIDAQKNARYLEKSMQSMAAAWSCAESALLSLRNDWDYDGDETINVSFGYGYPGGIGYTTTPCTIYPIGGYGNDDRSLCTHATIDGRTRYLEIGIQRIKPDISIDSWEEATSVTLCTSPTL